jgi:AraC-like DNA-binding protein
MRIPSCNGIAWAMAPFLKRLAQLTIRDEVPPDEHRVVESVVDLIGSLCAMVLTDDVGPRAHSRAELVLRIRAYIDAHLSDPDLTPTRLAATHFISKRYLHKLFEAEGVSVACWIRERRLERCRSGLVDPRWREETIASVGVRCGLTDAAHFSRLFRETYGCTPGEYRRLDLQAAS